MLDLDPELLKKALADRPDAAFVTVARADGSSALVSRSLAEWFVSSAPAPDQADVDMVLRGATRARVVERRSVWAEPSSADLDEVVHADVSDPAALEELRGALRVEDAGGHLLLTTSFALEISGPEGRRASIGVLRLLSRLRWKGRWQTDARLVDPWALARWIAAHGSDQPLREAQELAATEAREAAADARARDAWSAAMPAALRPVWPRFADDPAIRMGRYDVDVSEATAVLRSSDADESATLRDVLVWTSLRPHSGRGWDPLELIALKALRSFATDDALVSCLAAAPPPAVVAGARRFLEWYRGFGCPDDSSTRARRRHKAACTELRRRLVEVCPALDPPS